MTLTEAQGQAQPPTDILQTGLVNGRLNKLSRKHSGQAPSPPPALAIRGNRHLEF